MVEERRKEDERLSLLVNIRDPLEKKRLEKILAMEKTQANEKIVEFNKQMDKKLLEFKRELDKKN